MPQSRPVSLKRTPRPTSWRALSLLTLGGFVGGLLAFLKPQPSASAYFHSGATGVAILQAAATAAVLIGALAIVERLYFWARAEKSVQ